MYPWVPKPFKTASHLTGSDIKQVPIIPCVQSDSFSPALYFVFTK
uniref:Uncharacterized protein n=1 Tax=Anguilla anguilla TaxID=7936 RepID=A0A0E9QRE4_ANGAN